LDSVDKLIQYPEVPDLDDIIELMDEVIAKLPNLVIFVDGIDELKEKEQKMMLKTLWAFVDRHSHCKIRFCVSSRQSAAYMVTPSEAFQTYSLHLEQTSIANDIDIFVTHSVEEAVRQGDLIPMNQSLKEIIAKKLISGSKGM
jgi:hypothetical protein